MSLPDLLCLCGTELLHRAWFLGASAVFMRPCAGGRTAEHALGFVGLSHIGNVCLTWAVCLTQAVCCTQAVYVPHGQYVPHRRVFHMGSVSHTGNVSHGHCVPHRQGVSHGQRVPHGQCVLHGQCVSHTGSVVPCGQCVPHGQCFTWAVCVPCGQCVPHRLWVSHGHCVSHTCSMCPTWAVDCVWQTKAMQPTGLVGMRSVVVSLLSEDGDLLMVLQVSHLVVRWRLCWGASPFVKYGATLIWALA